MNDKDDQVLTDEEKDALLQGVESGAVEVQSANGPTYANVRPYVIGPRSRLTSDGLPRLENVNEQLAERLGAACAGLLQMDVEVTAAALSVKPFADFRDLWPSRCVTIAFSAAPLSGEALVVVDSVLIGPLVEAFYGGGGEDQAAHDGAAHAPGSLGTVQLFASEILTLLRELWAPLTPIEPQRVATHLGLDTIETIDAPDGVIVSEFEIALGAEQPQRGSFCVVWPEASVAPLRPALEGKRRERDASEDRRWGTALRARLPEVIVPLGANVGRASMTLGEIVNLKPGDVIGIDTPRVATLKAAGVPLLEGRFGVQAGRNAVETVCWLDVEASQSATTGHVS